MTLFNLTDIGRAGDPASLVACTSGLVDGLLVYGLLIIIFLIAFVKVSKWDGAASGFVHASFYAMLVSVLMYAASETTVCPFMSSEPLIVTIALFVLALLMKIFGD